MRTLSILFFFLCAGLAQAQTPAAQKIGYADWEYIFNQMPDYKQIDNDMKIHGSQLENQLKAKYTEYQAKLTAFNGLPATTPDAVRSDKQAELTQLGESIQKFQQDAQSSLQKRQTDLMAPVYTKVGKAIGEVAKENGFSFIFNPQMSGGGEVILYRDEKYNISDLVLKKMGITPAPATLPPGK